MYLVQLPLPMVLPLILVFPGQVLNYITVYSTTLKVELYVPCVAATAQGLISKHHVSWPGVELDHGLFHYSEG